MNNPGKPAQAGVVPVRGGREEESQKTPWVIQGDWGHGGATSTNEGTGRKTDFKVKLTGNLTVLC